MIEKYFTQPKTVVRLHAGLLGPHLSTIAEALHEARYSAATIRLHLRAADRFGPGSGHRRSPSLISATPSSIGIFKDWLGNGPLLCPTVDSQTAPSGFAIWLRFCSRPSVCTWQRLP